MAAADSEGRGSRSFVGLTPGFSKLANMSTLPSVLGRILNPKLKLMAFPLVCEWMKADL